MFKNKKIIKKFIGIILTSVFLYSCVGSSSVGVFGSGVSVAFDPRTVGMQIDDSIMQKNLVARLALTEKKYLLSISVKILDGNIFLSGKVDQPEEKLKIIKMAWETKGVRSVKSAITIKGQITFKNTAKDVLITSQLRTALIFNKLTKSTNYNIDTINGKVYIFGIAITGDEKKEVIKEAQDVYGVKEVIPSIILIEDLSRTKN
jgi:osmotically-inducible protein OsmY